MGRLFHGVNIEEVPTRVLPPHAVSAAIPFVVGLAPVHLTDSASADVVNTPVLCSSYEEFVTLLGDAPETSKWTLCEFAKVFFGLYNAGPAVFLNVFDPAGSVTEPISSSSVTLVAGTYTIPYESLLTGLIVKSSDGNTTYVEDVDYTAVYDADGLITITRLTTGTIPSATSTLRLSYNKILAAPCDAEDIIGGYDEATGKNSGLQAIEDVYPLLGVIPGLILAPAFSATDSVAAAMIAKTVGINNLFSAVALIDVAANGSTGCTLYSQLSAWKNSHGLGDSHAAVCWPRVLSGGSLQWLSNHLAGRIAATDYDNGDIPVASPSNKPLRINGAVKDDSAAVVMTLPMADTLSSAGIVTALQFQGWKCWGNRTGAYPGDTDPKDAFLSVRRMMTWIGNNVVLLLWQKLDDPLSRRTVETAVDSVNEWLNGLIARGAINAGRCEFQAGENTNSSLSDGKLTLHLYVTPPSPAEQINVVLEYDVNGNSALFS